MLFNADEAELSAQYDRAKLPPGRYLVKLKDARDVVGAHKGNRTQIDFEVLAGPGVPAGTVKAQQFMQQVKADLQRKEDGKKQKWIAAFGSKPGVPMDPRKVTNELYPKVVREQRGKSSKEGFEVKSESFPAEKGLYYGRKAVVVSVPHTNKKGEKTVFYTVEAYNGVEKFLEYDPSKFVDEEAKSASTDEDDAGLSEAAAQAAEDDETPPPPEEDEPLTLAARDGWEPRTGHPGWYINKKTKEQLKEAKLIAKYAA